MAGTFDDPVKELKLSGRSIVDLDEYESKSPVAMWCSLLALVVGSLCACLAGENVVVIGASDSMNASILRYTFLLMFTTSLICNNNKKTLTDCLCICTGQGHAVRSSVRDGRTVIPRLCIYSVHINSQYSFKHRVFGRSKDNLRKQKLKKCFNSPFTSF